MSTVTSLTVVVLITNLTLIHSNQSQPKCWITSCVHHFFPELKFLNWVQKKNLISKYWVKVKCFIIPTHPPSPQIAFFDSPFFIVCVYLSVNGLNQRIRAWLCDYSVCGRWCKSGPVVHWNRRIKSVIPWLQWTESLEVILLTSLDQSLWIVYIIIPETKAAKLRGLN